MSTYLLLPYLYNDNYPLAELNVDFDPENDEPQNLVTYVLNELGNQLDTIDVWQLLDNDHKVMIATIYNNTSSYDSNEYKIVGLYEN